jgi:uncharacterized LabA/DUF88 family protein
MASAMPGFIFMKEAVLFIDGNNLYHNLKFMQISPGDLDFKKLVDIISRHFNCEIKEVRYYNSIPNINQGKDTYFSHLKFIDDLKKLPKFTIHTRKLQVHSTKEIIREMKNMIHSIKLCNNCKPLVEDKFFSIIGKTKSKEKGIDVMIAVDLVEYAIKNKAEQIILLSGDTDFIHSMEIAKGHNKEVFSVSTFSGYSKELREKFKFFVLTDNLIKYKCLKL